jgi:hypothetical protein
VRYRPVRALCLLSALVFLAACTGPDRGRPHRERAVDRHLAGKAMQDLESDFPLRVITPAQSYGRHELRDAMASIAEPWLHRGCLQATQGQYEFFDLPGKTFTVTILLFPSSGEAKTLFEEEEAGKSICPLLGNANRCTPDRVVFRRGPFLARIVADARGERWLKEAYLLASQLDERLAVQ